MTSPTYHFPYLASSPATSFHTVTGQPAIVPSETGHSHRAVSSSGTATPSSLAGKPDKAGLEQSLFENRAELKILTSRIAMHISLKERDDVFQQVDDLLSIDNWCDGDSKIAIESFRTFLRFLAYYRNIRRPSLTVSNTGTLSCSWFDEEHRLTVEMSARDVIRVIGIVQSEAETAPETFVYQGNLLRLESILGPFNGIGWFRNEQ